MTVSEQLAAAHEAARIMPSISDGTIDKVLTDLADTLVAETGSILAANAKDLARMDESDPRYDRLRLTPERIAAIAADTRNVAVMRSPRNRVIDTRTRPNGLEITRIAVALGVVGVIYEARPNVTVDVFSLCFKSGNIAVMKGGHDADDSNRCITSLIHRVLDAHGLSKSIATLLPSTREATEQLLNARGLVDVIIPRGSARLIAEVREKARIPVIETGAGVCHCFIDSSADTTMAAAIVNNAKTRRVSVCNALDCVICHAGKLKELPDIVEPLAESQVIIHADSRSYAALAGHYPENLLCHAEDMDFGREYLGYAMSVKTVDNVDEALDHIARYGSGHSESAVTSNAETASRFSTLVDAACVYINAPTSFTDGAQFGLGAEIGISTQKLHARGPMGLEELMTYKWLVSGNGQTRP